MNVSRYNPPDITIKDRVGYILNTYVIKKKLFFQFFNTVDFYQNHTESTKSIHPEQGTPNNTSK